MSGCQRFARTAHAGFCLLLAGIAPAQAPQVGGGTISTMAGNGTSGFSGDGGPADQAMLNFVLGAQLEEFGHLALDSAGNLYIADKGNHRIRRVAPNGVISTFAGTGTRGFSGDSGQATSANLSFPCGLAADGSGNVYITEQGNDRVRRVDRNGVITTIAGNGRKEFSGDGGPATSAGLSEPAAVAVDAAGNIYIADMFNDRVRMITARTGVISTIAGNGFHADDNPGRDNVDATSVALGFPVGLALDGAGNLYLSDHHNNCVRVVNLQNGMIRRLAGTARHPETRPRGDGGPAAQAELDFPVGLAFDAAGNLFIADFHSNLIRRVAAPVSPTAIITSVVGTGIHGYGGDGGPGWDAILDYPAGLAMDSAGNLIFADWHNHRVRKVTPGSGAPRPVISQGGVVNGASFAPAPARVAPGSVIAIFGTRLAPAEAAASALPLPTALGSVAVDVTFGRTTLQMPLFYVSPGQINAQLPVEVPHSAPADVVVRLGGLRSEPLTINVSLSETGIFTYQSNRAVAVNQDGALNSSTAPAPRGSVITVYLTGQGALDPEIPSGLPAPVNRLSRAANEASATIGGVAAQIEFLGATPGFVALSQANITVPADAPTGDQPLVITVAGHPSNRPLVSVR